MSLLTLLFGLKTQTTESDVGTITHNFCLVAFQRLSVENGRWYLMRLTEVRLKDLTSILIPGAEILPFSKTYNDLGKLEELELSMEKVVADMISLDTKTDIEIWRR